MANACIEKLLKENETVLLRERRVAERKSFTRPVTIAAGKDRDELHEAFSRDISPIGIGIISRVNWPERTRAELTIQTISSRERVHVFAEVRWTKPFGTGWFVTGWHFVS